MDVGVVRDEVGDFRFSCTATIIVDKWQVYTPSYPPPGWYYAYKHGSCTAGVNGTTSIAAALYADNYGDVYISIDRFGLGVVTPTVTIGPSKVGDYTLGGVTAAITITLPGKKLREYVDTDAETGERVLRRGWQTSDYTTGTIRIECEGSIREGTFDVSSLTSFIIGLSCLQVGNVGDQASIDAIGFSGEDFILSPLTYYMPGLDLEQEAGSEAEIVVTGSSITNTVLVEDGGFSGFINIGLPYKMIFNPASFNTDYTHPVTNIEYTVDAIEKW